MTQELPAKAGAERCVMRIRFSVPVDYDGLYGPPPWETVRVTKRGQERCGHVHRSSNAAMKCANAHAGGREFGEPEDAGVFVRTVLGGEVSDG